MNSGLVGIALVRIMEEERFRATKSGIHYTCICVYTCMYMYVIRKYHRTVHV